MSKNPIILACTDGSIYAPSVYDHAAWAASRLKADVQVLHIIDLRREAVPHVNLSGSIGINAHQTLRDELVTLDEARGRAAQAKATVILTEARAHFERAGLKDVQTDARHGTLVDTIGEWEPQAGLVVIGKRGESADFDKLHLGANLERVIRACAHPVLVASREFQPIERMLIAFDGGPSARRSIEFVATQPLLQGLECILFAAGHPTPTIEKDLQGAVERLRNAGYQVDARHKQGHPEELIAETVKQERINLLVMGAYGHSRIRQFIVGSTTTTMVRTSRTPVLMFR